MPRPLLAIAVIACSSSPPSSPDAQPHVPYDIVVVGAGTGGTAAAIAAARHGAHVLLVEPTYWIGGQMATVSRLEDAQTDHSSGVATGFVEEFRAALRQHYAAIGLTSQLEKTRWYGEPNVIRDVLTNLLASATVDVKLRTTVTAIARDGSTVTGLTLSDGTIVDSQIVIDATETGDVLPLAGVAYHSGNQDSRRPIDLTACLQSITYVVPIRKYPSGPPSELVFASPPPGYDTAMHDLFAANVVDPPNPTPGAFPWGWAHHNAYRQVPDSAGAPYAFDAMGNDIDTSITRTSMNMANDYPTIGNLPIDYLESPDARRAYECNARLTSLQFLYYAQHDIGESQWSVADDEGFDTDFDCPNIPAELVPIARKLPPFPYIRESRRIVALHTLTGEEIRRTNGVAATRFHTSVARSWYTMDLHRCTADANVADPTFFEPGTGDGNAFPALNYGAVEIPFESLIPIDTDGLLAAEKNIGVSRRANGSTRLEGVTMLTGEAVGVLAALAVASHTQPRAIDPYALQKALVADGDGLSMYEPFDDVPTSDPAWGAIQLAMTRGLLDESTPTAFSPAGTLPRNVAAKAFALVFKLPLTMLTSEFTDVPTGDPYVPYIEAIFHAGLTAGCGGTNFCPGQAMQRAQIAVFIAKGLGATPPACTSQPFSDVLITDGTCPFIEYVTSNGLMSDCGGGSFCPTATVTRAETATALTAIMNRIGAPP